MTMGLGGAKLNALAEGTRQRLAVAGMAQGKLPRMRLEDILEDPENARSLKDQETPAGLERQAALDADVKERGVKSPISLRPHPTIPSKWIINFGHRRYKAAKHAGLLDIPYFIDEEFDSFDQVNENELHSKLTPWAMAAFVDRKLEEGYNKGQIAARLQKTQNVVTEYQALLDAPECLHIAYAAGVKSPRTLYDLRRAWDEFPKQIELWCENGARVTRDTVKDLLEKLRHDVKDEALAANDPLVPAPQLAATMHTATPAAAAATDSQSVVPDTSSAAQELRHDVKMEAGLPAESVKGPNAPVLPRHQHGNENDGRLTPTAKPEPTKPKGQELRYDVKTSAHACRQQQEQPVQQNDRRGDVIKVRYKGKVAAITPSSTVTILLEEADTKLDVLVSELVIDNG